MELKVSDLKKGMKLRVIKEFAYCLPKGHIIVIDSVGIDCAYFNCPCGSCLLIDAHDLIQNRFELAEPILKHIKHYQMHMASVCY